jgi:hypothetical protein
MCSITSKTSSAVVAGSITTETESGGDGICSVSKALLMENPPNTRCLAGLQFQCCDYRIMLAAWPRESGSSRRASQIGAPAGKEDIASDPSPGALAVL